jgi:hypothetical protein
MNWRRYNTLKALETVAAQELYRSERRILVAGFLAPWIFLLTLNASLFANSASLSCAAALVVEHLLAKKFYAKYQENIGRAEDGWYARPSPESQALHRRCLALGIYGVLLWGFGSYPVTWLVNLVCVGT